MSPLDRNPGRHVHFSRLDWLRWRAGAWLDLHVYAARWTLQRQHLKLRAGLPSRPASQPARGSARVQTRLLQGEPEAGPSASPQGPAGTGPDSPFAGPVPPGATRDDMAVIHAGGMLLPDRPREDPDPEPFRIRPYYLLHEMRQAERWWSE